MHRQQSVADWLRTGRGQSGRIDVKFNPWHDPDDGKFTFRNSGSFFGEGGSTDFAQRPRRDDPRVLAIGRAKRREGAKDKPTISTFRPGGGSFGGAGASGNWDGPIRRPAKAASAVATLHGALRLTRPIIRSPAPTPVQNNVVKAEAHKTAVHRVQNNASGYSQAANGQTAQGEAAPRPATAPVQQQQAAAPQNSPIGIGVGAVIGGLLGNQIGSGDGKTLATIAGAVGGGYLGNEVAKRNR